MNRQALIIFARNLIEGQVKTRLAATLGNEVALDIYKQLLKKVQQTVQSLNRDKIVFYSDYIEEDIWDKDVYKKRVQQGDSLGKRMENAFKSSFVEGYQKLVIIGTDCPGINETILENAFAKLEEYDIVIGPAIDGGYYLLGMTKESPCLFQNIPWSTQVVFEQTIDICKKHSLSYFVLPELSDIDEEKDLQHFKELVLNKRSS